METPRSSSSPQRDTAASRGQLPTRLIDAMAAGLATVSTKVGDIPEWLSDGSGIVVEPDDADGLARGIQEALDFPARTIEMGHVARQRFRRLASFDAIRPDCSPRSRT